MENMVELQEKIRKLIKEKKINELHSMLDEINSADFPSLFEELKQDEIVIIYRLLPKEKAAEVFAELDSDVQKKLINVFTDKELKTVINELFMDDTVDLIEEMPASVVKRILKNIGAKDRKIINELLNYPEDSAGSIMTTEFVEFKENITVQEGFDIIKKTGIKKETVYHCYVVDKSRKLVGSVDIKEMLISDRDLKITEIMEENPISVLTSDDKEDVAKKFDKYNYMAMPVVDTENRLVGIVTIDDAIDVIQEENTEDFEKMAAMIPNEETYFKTGVFTHAKNRILWLLVLMISSTFTGAIIEKYQSAFAAVPVLVAFIPMIMGTGGNCGSQSSTLVIRGLALDEIKISDIFKVIWKELRVAIVVGTILALVTAIRIYFQYGSSYQGEIIHLSLVVGLTLILTAILAKLVGGILPMIAKTLKLDPAIMAAPLISTIVDMCSILIFFKCAVMIMGI